MLDLEVVPELALRHKKWQFILGMPMQQAIDIIKKQENVIKSVEFWYSDKVPFHMDLVLCLPQDGIKLHFDPCEQRLKIIEVYTMSKIMLRYCLHYFNSPSVQPTTQVIDQTFGATTAPQQDSETGTYLLSFRGLAFVLSPMGAEQDSAQPVVGLKPAQRRTNVYVVTKMSIYSGNSLPDTKVPPSLPGECFNGNIFLEKLEVLREDDHIKELVFHLTAQDINKSPSSEPKILKFDRTIRFGDTVQDVVSALGSSSRVFYKAEDKMKIHSPQAHRLIQTRNADYFYNYITLGVDILFDARCHRVKKLVLHTNIPGHYNFNSYYRCLFEIPVSRPPSSGSSPQNPFLIGTFTKWSEIQAALGKNCGGEPVILNRSGNGNNQNPFGSTHCYGYTDMIFEIIPTNEHIASVTLYRAIPQPSLK